MRTVSRARQIGQVRLFALLALLLGLLAMHGLGSTHHASAATAGAAHSAAPAGVHGHGQHAAAHTASVPSTVAGLWGPLCSDDCPGSLALLCVAVLASAVAAAALCRHRGRDDDLARPWRQQQKPGPGAADRPPDTLDPVAELCVSRT